MQLIHLSNSRPNSLILHKPCLHGSSYNHPCFQVGSTRPLLFPNQKQLQRRVRNGCSGSGGTKIKAVAVSEAIEKKSVKVKATVTVQPTVGGLFSERAMQRGLDDIKDLLGQSILLELVGADLDPSKYMFKQILKKKTILMFHQVEI